MRKSHVVRHSVSLRISEARACAAGVDSSVRSKDQPGWSPGSLQSSGETLKTRYIIQPRIT